MELIIPASRRAQPGGDKQRRSLSFWQFRLYNAGMASANSESGQRRFATTSWSLVAAAQDPASPHAEEALAALCGSYWYPLYAFIRRQGYPADQAEDLTQEFFTRLLEKDFLAVVDRTKGKFRSFLLAACSHFLANERDRARAWKRGGRSRLVGLDFAAAESRYAQEPAQTVSPEKLFARRWALTLLDQVLSRLRAEYASKGKVKVFDRLRVCLLGEGDAVPHARLADELALSAGAVRVAVHRLRQQFRELLCEEIARTVQHETDIEDEIRDLFAALGR
jgi:RNA polymerase sigma-70 factor (ECF subfamily)